LAAIALKEIAQTTAKAVPIAARGNAEKIDQREFSKDAMSYLPTY